jgi:6-phosphogluconolactonase
MSGTAPEVLVHADGTLLAEAAAARTITRLVDAISALGQAHLVLTGGGLGEWSTSTTVPGA